MTQLYLIRHGEAMGAIKGFVGDGGLSPLGVQQAEQLRDRLLATKEIAADVFIASTLPRAQQTAQIIAPAIGVPLQYDDEIQEMRPGEADGMPVDEFRKLYGEPDFETNPYHPVAPGGESWGQFMLRVGTALDRILRTHEGKTILLVCHGGVIDGAFLYFFKTSAWTPPEARFYTRNTSITHWQQYTTYQQQQRWRMIRYNDAFHLYDIGTSARIPWGELLHAPASDDNRPSVPVPSE
jgi:probable phosphoglycerate mutase